MSEHTATIRWQRDEHPFANGRYSRRHEWHFDGGAIVPGSASPFVVRAPFSDASAVDPEEAFVAALSSCHMLWFLSTAAEHGFIVDSYEDECVGYMRENDAGKLCVAEAALRPRTTFSGDAQPTRRQLNELHLAAHAKCFIANSVKTNIRIEPR
jgi:organic hydroperoxide reductase OsmC/OhrA